MKHIESERTVVAIANAAELVAAVAMEVMGNDVANTFNGSPITRSMVHDLSITTFQNNHLHGKGK
jgi:hypothetical protein